MKEKYKDIDEWREEAIRRFGVVENNWRFVCPSCGHVASIRGWKDAGATDGQVAFSCIGRNLPGKPSEMLSGDIERPCNYAGGGLIGLNPIQIKGLQNNVFAFADPEV